MGFLRYQKIAFCLYVKNSRTFFVSFDGDAQPNHLYKISEILGHFSKNSSNPAIHNLFKFFEKLSVIRENFCRLWSRQRQAASVGLYQIRFYFFHWLGGRAGGVTWQPLAVVASRPACQPTDPRTGSRGGAAARAGGPGRRRRRRRTSG